jgi:hypothetical protein
MYRQGDLLFIKTDEVSGVKQHSLDILYSSLTGHSHSITKGEVYVNEPERWGRRGNFYVTIPEGGADLVHQEHKTINLPEGIYEVRRQQEVNGYVVD